MNILLRLTSMRITDIYLLEKSGGKVVAGNWNSKYLLSIASIRAIHAQDFILSKDSYLNLFYYQATYATG